jgi:hypothetical protein
MAYEVKDPFLQFVDHWQTLITGIFALIAAFGTIWATKSAAKREISTAQEQLKVTRYQIEVMLRLERRRLARETYAFLATLMAATKSVIDDVQAAQTLIDTDINFASITAYAARTKTIKKTAFSDIRSACLRFGGQLTEPFLRLEKEIDILAEQVTHAQSMEGGFIMQGETRGLKEELERIRLQAKCLYDEAASGMQRCNKVLEETQETESGVA